MCWSVERVVREECLANVRFGYVGKILEKLFLYIVRDENLSGIVLIKMNKYQCNIGI